MGGQALIVTPQFAFLPVLMACALSLMSAGAKQDGLVWFAKSEYAQNVHMEFVLHPNFVSVFTAIPAILVISH